MEDKNYIENKINSIKEALNNSINDAECYSDVFNELVGRIYVFKEDDKKIKLDIYIKTGEEINTFSDNSGKKFHSLDYVTTKSLINDTLIINRGSISKYSKKYDVIYEFRCLVNII